MLKMPEPARPSAAYSYLHAIPPFGTCVASSFGTCVASSEESDTRPARSSPRPPLAMLPAQPDPARLCGPRVFPVVGKHSKPAGTESLRPGKFPSFSALQCMSPRYSTTLGAQIGCVLNSPFFRGVSIAGGIMGAAGHIEGFANAVAGGDGYGAVEHGGLALMGILDVAAAFGQACFAAGTPILTPDGSKPIEAFRAGDWILSAPENDPEASPAPRQVEQVFQTFSPVMELRVGGRAIRTTAEHPFWVRGKGWTHAQQINKGNELYSHDGTWVKVDAIGPAEEAIAVYNFRVAEYHTYFVGSSFWGFSLWAHNADYVRGNTPPTLPQQTIVRRGQIRIEHYFNESKDHGPAHLHISDGPIGTRIGAQGRPGIFKGDAELTPAMARVVREHRREIRAAVKKFTTGSCICGKFTVEFNREGSLTMAEIQEAWVFKSEGTHGVGAIFLDLTKAEDWISKHSLSGILLCYPVDEGVFDWALREGRIKKKFAASASKHIIGAFCSGLHHYHYDNGNRIG